MSRTAVRCSLFGALCALFISANCSRSLSATINYPDQGPIPPGIMFTNIYESTGTDTPPLYGPPTGIPTGMTFTPTPAFSSSSAGGGADITDGQLNYTMMAGPQAGGIPVISFSEAGTYTLGGVGAGTTASVGAILRATVLEVNGAPVAPIALAPVNASLAYTLPADLGSSPWALSLSVNVAGQLPANSVATKVEVVINNSLATSSTATSSAQINKSDLTVIITPEPSAIALCGVLFAAIGGRRFLR